MADNNDNNTTTSASPLPEPPGANLPPGGGAVPPGEQAPPIQERRRELRRKEDELDISKYTSWRPTRHEFIRLIFQGAAIVALMAPDWGAIRTMSYVLGVFFGITMIAHISRKYSLFPYVDMRELYNRAKKDPIASAIVFASVAGIIIVCIDTAGKFFARG